MGLVFGTLIGLLMLPSETKTEADGKTLLHITGLYQEERYVEDWGLFYIKER